MKPLIMNILTPTPSLNFDTERITQPVPNSVISGNIEAFVPFDLTFPNVIMALYRPYPNSATSSSATADEVLLVEQSDAVVPLSPSGV
jgi:hypothetical protein